jgi:hypothetical protein
MRKMRRRKMRRRKMQRGMAGFWVLLPPLGCCYPLGGEVNCSLVHPHSHRE